MTEEERGGHAAAAVTNIVARDSSADARAVLMAELLLPLQERDSQRTRTAEDPARQK